MKKSAVPFLALCALFSSAAFAGTWSNVTVISITVLTGEGYVPKGAAMVTFSAASTGSASCAGTTTNQAAINIDTIGGAMAASMLQPALLIGSTVTVIGMGKCPTMGTIENIAKVTASKQ